MPKPDEKQEPPRAAGRERRSAPRFRFTARADVKDRSADSMLAGRLLEISQKGCYVNIVTAPPLGTRIHLRITHGLDTFKTQAEVRHVEPGTGMGLLFIDTPDDQKKILTVWLAELSASG